MHVFVCYLKTHVWCLIKQTEIVSTMPAFDEIAAFSKPQQKPKHKHVSLFNNIKKD